MSDAKGLVATVFGFPVQYQMEYAAMNMKPEVKLAVAKG